MSVVFLIPLVLFGIVPRNVFLVEEKCGQYEKYWVSFVYLSPYKS